jgi:hypothetical protein
VLVVLLLLVPELPLEVLLLPLLPLPDVVDEGLVLPPLLLLLLPLPVSVLLPPLSVLLPPPPVLPVSAASAPWSDGIMDGSGVLLLLLSLPLSLLPSILLLSDVVGGGGGGGAMLLLSWLLLSDAVGRVGVVVLPSLLLSTLLALPLVMSSLDFELVVLPALLLLSPTAMVGVDVSGVDLSSDLCLFFVLLVSSEGAAGGGGHFPFTGIEPSGHGRDIELRISLLPPSPLLLPAWLLEGVDIAASGVDLSSDLFFFAAKTLWDTSNVKAIVVTERTRIKMINRVIV